MSARHPPFGPAPSEPLSLHSHNARERIKAVYAALSHGADSTLLDQLDPGVVWEFCGTADLPFAGVFHGRDGVVLFLERLGAVVDPARFEARDYVVAGERVVAIGQLRGVARESGRAFTVPLAQIWEVGEGRVRGARAICDTATLRDALAP